MKVSYLRKSGPEYITGALRATSGKDMFSLKSPTLKTWEKLLYTAGGVPHSPIRAVEYRVYVEDIPYCNAMHYRTHHVGVQFYIKSQREDRIGDSIPRSEKSQTELVDMMFDINANSIINMAMARLCAQADKETRELMKLLRNQFLDSEDPYDICLAKYMKPPCEWYNKCFEVKPCKKGKNYPRLQTLW